MAPKRLEKDGKKKEAQPPSGEWTHSKCSLNDLNKLVRLEWNIELPRGDMDRVDELLDTIAAHKETGVTGASVMFSFFKRRVQPIQQHHILGFEYKGAEDPSHMWTEELTDEAALTRVRQVLLDVDAVPYVLQLFAAQNPPKPVSVQLLYVENKFCSATAN
jgi:hypothetical protein